MAPDRRTARPPATSRVEDRQVEGPGAGIRDLDRIDDARLSRSHLLHATRGEFLRQLGRIEEARDALQQAHDRAPTGTERRFLEDKLAGLMT